jgi:hypothetical protein
VSDTKEMRMLKDLFKEQGAMFKEQGALLKSVMLESSRLRPQGGAGIDYNWLLTFAGAGGMDYSTALATTLLDPGMSVCVCLQGLPGLAPGLARFA